MLILKHGLLRMKLVILIKAKFNILMFPEFIGALTITTYHSAAKTIEVNMEQLSNRLKAIAESHIYKKA